MKNEHKKSRDYLNMEIPLDKLAKPKTKSEKVRYAQRMEKEWARDYGEDYEYMPDSIYYEEMTDKERRLDDKKSRDYLDRGIPFDYFGRPRTKEEVVLFRCRCNSQYGDLGEYYDDLEDDEEEDEYFVKVMDQKGNMLTDLDDPCGIKSAPKGHRYYLDMEHPLTFDWFDVPDTNLELEMYNRRVEIDPNLTDADKLVGIPWPDHPCLAYSEENGEWEVMSPGEADERLQKNREMPEGAYKILGIGACGSRAIERVSQAWLRDATSVAMDTDREAFEASNAPRRRWLISEADDESEDDRAERQEHNEQAVLGIIKGEAPLLLALGLGGNAGAEILPLCLSIAKEEKPYSQASYVIGMATLPFAFEEDRRRTIAEEGRRQMEETADAVFLLPGDALLACAYRDFPLLSDAPADGEWTQGKAFNAGACVLGHCAAAMAALMAAPEDPEAAEKNRLWAERHCRGGFLYMGDETPENEPLPDVYPKAFGPDTEEMLALLRHCKPTSPGIGEGTGEKAIEEATKCAIMSPLLGDALEKASCVLVHVMCDPARLDRSIVVPAVKAVRKETGSQVRILAGVSEEEGLDDVVRVTIFAIVPDEEKREAVRRETEEKAEAKRRAKKKVADRQSKYRGRTILRALRMQPPED